MELRAADIVVRKARLDTFSTTDLHALFGDESINTLVVGAITTADAVPSTTREARTRTTGSSYYPTPRLISNRNSTGCSSRTYGAAGRT